MWNFFWFIAGALLSQSVMGVLEKAFTGVSMFIR
jgi:hypothetical protein